MKKLLLTLSIFCLLLASCGKSKIKTYTMAEKEAYCEKAVNGDEEAKKFVEERIAEAKKIFDDTGDSVAKNEYAEWINTQMNTPYHFPVEKSKW